MQIYSNQLDWNKRLCKFTLNKMIRVNPLTNFKIKKSTRKTII